MRCVAYMRGGNIRLSIYCVGDSGTRDGERRIAWTFKSRKAMFVVSLWLESVRMERAYVAGRYGADAVVQSTRDSRYLIDVAKARATRWGSFEDVRKCIKTKKMKNYDCIEKSDVDRGKIQAQSLQWSNYFGPSTALQSSHWSQDMLTIGKYLIHFQPTAPPNHDDSEFRQIYTAKKILTKNWEEVFGFRCG